MKAIYIRVNGRGNAWPIPLGQEHPFYSRNNIEDYANTSFSIINTNGNKSPHQKFHPHIKPQHQNLWCGGKINLSESASGGPDSVISYKKIHNHNINWEILIDAGHGIVQYLIKHNNRLPEAIILTHPHIDHTLSIDWIIQSYYRYNNKKRYPVYASKLCWELVVQSFPHLENIVKFNELKYGIPLKIKEAPDLKVIPFPVFHGENAPGATMLTFEYEDENLQKHKAIFSGDLLCPLLRNSGYQLLTDAKVLFVDANNRFPYPGCNHCSIISEPPEKLGRERTNFLAQWKENLNLSYLIAPHSTSRQTVKQNKAIHPYFAEFLKEKNENKLCLSVFDFVKNISPQNTMLVHYCGDEDLRYYNQEQFTDKQLLEWTIQQAKNHNISTKFYVPRTGDLFQLA